MSWIPAFNLSSVISKLLVLLFFEWWHRCNTHLSSVIMTHKKGKWEKCVTRIVIMIHYLTYWSFPVFAQFGSILWTVFDFFFPNSFAKTFLTVQYNTYSLSAYYVSIDTNINFIFRKTTCHVVTHKKKCVQIIFKKKNST